MKTCITKALIILFVSSLLGACTTRRTITYLQNVELAKQYTITHDRETKLQVGDRLQIKIMSAFPELVAPFNGGGYAMPGKTKGMEYSNFTPLGYTIRRDGTIDFPVLGKLRVDGLTITQVSDLIRERIIAGKYVTDPNVAVVFDNFTIYVLGAVDNLKGVSQQQTPNSDVVFTSYNMTGGGVLRVRERDKINILEALAMIGDLPIQAKIDAVNVIREEDGKYTTYRLNLKSADIFDSPAFYLKQHDIVYVEHRYKGEKSIDRVLQFSSYVFSTITSVVALVALFRSK